MKISRPLGGRLAANEGNVGLPWRLSSSRIANDVETATAWREDDDDDEKQIIDTEASMHIIGPKSSQSGPMMGKGFLDNLKE